MSCSKEKRDEREVDVVLANIDDLPNEILEYIFSHLSPYRDFKPAMLVCKRWHKIMHGVKYQIQSSFHQAINDGTLQWETLQSGECSGGITERYAHSACYYDKAVYVFGGCSSTSTTFNDLWKLDLVTSEWIRPLATGAYPSPKACATLVVHRDRLILFGGWSHPTPYTFHQASKFFYQLHSYCPQANRWSQILTPTCPTGKAGHGATVVNDKMVVFGGYHAHNASSNQVWVLDLIEESWSQKKTCGVNQPLARYGHTQTLLDEDHIVVVGGCGGPNKQLSDCWLLTMEHEPWFWTHVDMVNLPNAAHQLWCHPACVVNNKIIVVSKNQRMSLPTANPNKGSTKADHSTRAEPSARGEASSRASVKTEPGARAEASTRSDPGANAEPSASAEPGARTESGTRTEPGTRTESGTRTQPGTSADASVGEEAAAESRSVFAASTSVAVSRASTDHRHCGVGGRGHVKRSHPETSESSSDTDTDTSSRPQRTLPTHRTPPKVSAARTSDTSTEPGCSRSDSSPGPSSLRPGLPSVRPNAMKNRQKQLETLRWYEHKIKQQSKPEVNVLPEPTVEAPTASLNPMYVHVLDISRVLSEHRAVWRPVVHSAFSNAPEETIFYSVVEGRGEIILFGGIQMDLNSMQKGLGTSSHQQASKAMYFLRGVKSIR